MVGGVQKIESLLKMQILWIFFWGSPQNWTIFGVHFYAFTGLFLSSRYRTGIIFVCCLFFYLLLVILKLTTMTTQNVTSKKSLI